MIAGPLVAQDQSCRAAVKQGLGITADLLGGQFLDCEE